MKKFFWGILITAAISASCVGCSDNNDSLEYKNVESDDDISSSLSEESEAQSGDWSALEVKIDDIIYSPQFNYSQLVENGWSFDPAIYGLGDGIKSGVYISSDIGDIGLTNDSYEDGVLSIGIVNNADETKPVSESQVFSLTINVKDKLNRPNISVPGNISFGASADEIKALMGEPNETNRNDEEMYTELVYSNESLASIRYYVYDEGNMLGFSAKQF